MDLRTDARTSRVYSLDHGISPTKDVAQRVLASLGPAEQALLIAGGRSHGFRAGALVVTELRVLLVPPPGRGPVDVLSRRNTSGVLSSRSGVTVAALRSDTDADIRLLDRIPAAAAPALGRVLPRLESVAKLTDVHRWSQRPPARAAGLPPDRRSAPEPARQATRPTPAPPRPTAARANQTRAAAPNAPETTARSTARRMTATAGPSAPVSLSGGPPAYTWEAAEGLASVAMVYLGFPDAILTAGGKDDGVDVTARGAVAQVKFWQSAVGAPHVRDLLGAATAAQARALFFSLSGYTADASAFAERASVCLFTFTPDGTVVAASSGARSLLIDAIGRMAEPAEQRRLQAERSAFEATAREVERLTAGARRLTDQAKRTARTIRGRSAAKKYQHALAGIDGALTALSALDDEQRQWRREALVRDADARLRRAAKYLGVRGP